MKSTFCLPVFGLLVTAALAAPTPRAHHDKSLANLAIGEVKGRAQYRSGHERHRHYNPYPPPSAFYGWNVNMDQYGSDSQSSQDDYAAHGDFEVHAQNSLSKPFEPSTLDTLYHEPNAANSHAKPDVDHRSNEQNHEALADNSTPVEETTPTQPSPTATQSNNVSTPSENYTTAENYTPSEYYIPSEDNTPPQEAKPTLASEGHQNIVGTFKPAKDFFDFISTAITYLDLRHLQTPQGLLPSRDRNGP